MKKIFILLLMVHVLLVGCTNKNNIATKDNDKLDIYTTVYPLQYFTEQIGGDFVDVKTIYPAGADEHTFEPTQKDMIHLADADIFFYVGLGLEGFVDKAKKTLKNEQVLFIGAGENIHFDQSLHEEAIHEDDEHSDHEDDGHHHGDIDPHVWIDPVYAKEIAHAIKEALIEKMPEHKEQLEENYTALAKKLDQLNADFGKLMHESKHNEIIVSHAAFGYWEKRYGLEQISVSGLSSSDEPTQKELENILNVAKSHQLKYVFFEQNVNSRLTEIIQKELKAEPLILHNLAVLTSDDVKNKANYFSIMANNLAALKKALND